MLTKIVHSETPSALLMMWSISIECPFEQNDSENRYSAVNKKNYLETDFKKDLLAQTYTTNKQEWKWLHYMIASMCPSNKKFIVVYWPQCSYRDMES